MKLVTFLCMFFMAVIVAARASQPAMINDPDGFTYIRSGPDKESSIVATIQRGELFVAEPSGEGWWRVRSAAGQSGFMHRSRITLVTNQPSPSPSQPVSANINSSRSAAFSGNDSDARPNASTRYSVVGISDDDTLNVRMGPGMNYPIAARLANSATGIQVDGERVWHGNDDWIHITFATGEGWTRPKYLSTFQTSHDEALSSTALATSGPAPSPTPTVSNSSDGLVKTAVVVGGAYLLYKALTSGSNSGSSTKPGYHTCPVCHGEGVIHNPYGTCLNCDGTGEVADVSPLHEFLFPLDSTKY